MGLNAHRIHVETKLSKMTVSDYVTGSTKTLGGDKEAAIARYYGYSIDAIFGANDPDLQEKSYITKWRERAGISLATLAERVGTTVAIQELVEDGLLPLIGKRRRLLADALGIPEGFILIDPEAVENSHLIAAVELPSDKKSDGARVLRALSA